MIGRIPSTALPLVLCIGMAFGASAGEEERLRAGKTIVKLETVSGSKLKRGVTEGVIDAPLVQVWDVIVDYGNYAEFMPRVKKSRILEKNENRVRYYSYLHMPWPIADVEYECEVEFSKDRRALTFHLVPGTGKGVKEFNGDWEFREFEGNPQRTLARYSLFFESSHAYPNWAVNMGTKHTIGAILESVRRRLRNTAPHPKN